MVSWVEEQEELEDSSDCEDYGEITPPHHAPLEYLQHMLTQDISNSTDTTQMRW